MAGGPANYKAIFVKKLNSGNRESPVEAPKKEEKVTLSFSRHGPKAITEYLNLKGFDRNMLSLAAQYDDPALRFPISELDEGSENSAIALSGGYHKGTKAGLDALANTVPIFKKRNQVGKGSNQYGSYSNDQYGQKYNPRPPRNNLIKEKEDKPRRPYLTVGQGEKDGEKNIYSTEPADTLAATVERHAETYVPSFSQIKQTAKSLYGSIVSGVSYAAQRVMSYFDPRNSQGAKALYFGQGKEIQADRILANADSYSIINSMPVEYGHEDYTAPISVNLESQLLEESRVPQSDLEATIADIEGFLRKQRNRETEEIELERVA